MFASTCHPAGIGETYDGRMKRCGRCSESKPREAFALKSRYTMRLQSFFRACQHAYFIARYNAGKNAFVDKLRARTTAQRRLNRGFVVDILLRGQFVDCGSRDP